MFGALHPDEIEDILFAHHVCHLACIASGTPYVVPVTCVYHGGALYGITAPGRKVDALREHPAVALSIVDLDDPGRWRSVIVEGEWAEVEDTRERELAQELLATVPGGASPSATIVFRISPRVRNGRWLQHNRHRTATD
jgi:uncharacterized protein